MTSKSIIPSTSNNNIIQKSDSTSGGEILSSTLLPVAAVYNDLDFYLQSFKCLTIGNILEDICAVSDVDCGSDSDREHFIVISSNIDSKYNCGFVNRYSSLENIPSNPALYLNLDFGPVCNRLAQIQQKNTSSPSLIICGFDSGNLVALNTDTLAVVENVRVFHNIITSLRVNNSNSLLASGDFDGRLTLLDVESFIPLHIFDYAHVGSVNDVQFSPKNDEHMLLTCGGDCDVLLWDIRTNKSPTISHSASLQLTCTTQPTTLQWPSEYLIIFGTEYGNVVQYDLRSKKALSTDAVFPNKRIHKIQPLNNNNKNNNNNRVAYAFLAEDCNQMVIYDSEMRQCLYREQYPSGVQPRSVIEVKSNTKQQENNNTHRLVVIGTGQSIFVHDDILKTKT